MLVFRRPAATVSQDMVSLYSKGGTLPIISAQQISNGHSRISVNREGQSPATPAVTGLTYNLWCTVAYHYSFAENYAQVSSSGVNANIASIPTPLIEGVPDTSLPKYNDNTHIAALFNGPMTGTPSLQSRRSTHDIALIAIRHDKWPKHEGVEGIAESRAYMDQIFPIMNTIKTQLGG